MRIGLLSDTHGFLDDAVSTYFAECDEIWHAGDFGTMEVVSALRDFKPLRGVFGNVDGAAIRMEFPRDNEWACEGLRILMTHIGGYPGRYDTKVKQELLRRKPDLFLCGHSHILRVARDPALNLLHMNPGACGHHGMHRVRTILRFSIAAGEIGDVEAIELGPRGRRQAKNL